MQDKNEENISAEVCDVDKKTDKLHGKSEPKSSNNDLCDPLFDKTCTSSDEVRMISDDYENGRNDDDNSGRISAIDFHQSVLDELNRISDINVDNHGECKLKIFSFDKLVDFGVFGKAEDSEESSDDFQSPDDNNYDSSCSDVHVRSGINSSKTEIIADNLKTRRNSPKVISRNHNLTDCHRIISVGKNLKLCNSDKLKKNNLRITSLCNYNYTSAQTQLKDCVVIVTKLDAAALTKNLFNRTAVCNRLYLT